MRCEQTKKNLVSQYRVVRRHEEVALARCHDGRQLATRFDELLGDSLGAIEHAQAGGRRLIHRQRRVDHKA